jgi:hypothetical protein
MAVQKINLTGFTWGVTAETGINCESFKVSVKPEINEWVPGVDGQATGKVVGDPEGTLTISGEVKGSTGIMAAVVGTPVVPANSTTYFGRSAGGWYLDEGSVENMRSGLQKMDATFSSKFNVA